MSRVAAESQIEVDATSPYIRTPRGSVRISPEDVVRTRTLRWHVDLCGYVYAYTGTGTRRVLLHRYLLQAPPTLMVEHINGDPRDNRRENLRLLTHRQLSQKARARGRTGVKNVTIDPAYGDKFVVQVTRNRINHFGGRFGTLEAAAQAAQALRVSLLDCAPSPPAELSMSHEIDSVHHLVRVRLRKEDYLRFQEIARTESQRNGEFVPVADLIRAACRDWLAGYVEAARLGTLRPPAS